MPEKLYVCPHCGETWSILEIKEQECFECGYPNPVMDPEDALNGMDNDPEHSDTVGGLTPFFDAPKPPKGGFESATSKSFINNLSIIIYN